MYAYCKVYLFHYYDRYLLERSLIYFFIFKIYKTQVYFVRKIEQNYIVLYNYTRPTFVYNKSYEYVV